MPVYILQGIDIFILYSWHAACLNFRNMKSQPYEKSGFLFLLMRAGWETPNKKKTVIQNFQSQEFYENTGFFPSKCNKYRFSERIFALINSDQIPGKLIWGCKMTKRHSFGDRNDQSQE